MITVVWKELRENARWASLGFAAMAAAMFLEWKTTDLVVGGGYLPGMIAVFTAITLGILQTRQDKRPASRALLLHRGITADAAFAGKLLAGLALYSVAVFVPLLCMAIITAISGIEHRAASPMSVAPTALWALAAFAFWPATLLAVQRDARVLGSRLAPAMFAFFLVSPLSATHTNTALMVTLPITALGLCVLLLAARNVFTNSGHTATGAGRAALALAISFAFLLVFLMVGFAVDLYGLSNVRESSESASVHRSYVVYMGPEGQPWLGQGDSSSQDGTYQLTQTAKMVAGRSVRDQLRPIAETWKKTPCWLVDTGHNYRERGFWTRFTRLVDATLSSSGGWEQREYILDHKSDAILAYHRTLTGEWQLARRLRLPGPVRSFGEVKRYGQCDKDGSFTLFTSTGAFYVPGDGSAIITMYEAPNSSSILDSVEQSREEDEPFAVMPRLDNHFVHLKDDLKDGPLAVMLRLSDRVVLLESDLEGAAASQARPIGAVGNLGSLYAIEIRLPHALATTKSLSIARDPVRHGAYLGLAQSGDSSERRILWARFDVNGQIAAQQQYTENTIPDNVFGESVLYAYVPPGVWALVTSIALITTEDCSIPETWEEAWEGAWKAGKEDPAGAARAALLFLLQPIVAVPLAIWAARRRRLGKRQTWLCLVWGFLLGPAGSFSVLAVYPRITRDRCIACQRPTRIDLDFCEHCSHPADDVPRIGIEIFGRGPRAAAPGQIGSMEKGVRVPS